MEINEYVRTKDGMIYKNYGEGENYFEEIIYVSKDHCSYDSIKKDDISKASFNLIDLIEKGDILVDYNDDLYVVDYIDGYYVFTTAKINKTTIKTLVDYQIKKVLTKEQFESNAYKIEKER